MQLVSHATAHKIPPPVTSFEAVSSIPMLLLLPPLKDDTTATMAPPREAKPAYY